MTKKQASTFRSTLILGVLLSSVVFRGGPAYADDPSVPALIKDLHNGDSDQRRAAVQALGSLGSNAKSAIPALRKALSDDSPYVSMGAAKALAHMGADAVPALIDALKSENNTLRATGAEALAQIGPEASAAAPALAAALSDPDSTVRSRAATALERIGSPSAPSVVKALKTGNEQTRLLCIHILGSIDNSEPEVLNPLIEQLSDRDHQIVVAAVKAIGRKGSAAVPPLIQTLKSEDPQLRRLACEVLGDIGRDAAAAVPALTETLKDSEAPVRASAARALGKMGSKAISAVPALRIASKDADPTVASKSAEALTSIAELFANDNPSEPKKKAPTPEVTPAIPAPVKTAAATAKPPKTPVKKAPITSRKIQGKKVKALPLPTPAELLLQLQSPDVAVSSSAAAAIVQRSSETVPLLIQTLKESSTAAAEISADLLTKIGTDEAKKAVEDYRKLLSDKKRASLLRDLREGGKTSMDAARELVKIGDPIVKPVAQILADPRPENRRAAAGVLNQLGAAAAPATSSLIEALDDKDTEVRKQSAEALAKIGSPEAKKALRFQPLKEQYRKILLMLHLG